ncbi:MAG: hypothetical protein CL949_16820 [Erythrobacter sp.]|nr:hypothetical protein [Erythrobacter sp.]
MCKASYLAFGPRPAKQAIAVHANLSIGTALHIKAAIEVARATALLKFGKERSSIPGEHHKTIAVIGHTANGRAIHAFCEWPLDNTTPRVRLRRVRGEILPNCATSRRDSQNDPPFDAHLLILLWTDPIKDRRPRWGIFRQGQRGKTLFPNLMRFLLWKHRKI